MNELALAVLLAALPSAATARTFYISPRGGDAHAGTNAASPFKTFERAFTVMEGGDELVLLDGVYGEAQGTGYISYAGIGSAQPPSGRPGAPTVVRAKTAGTVKVIGGLFLGRSFRSDSWIVIEGVTFEGVNDGTDGHAGALYNTQFVTIKNCGFHDDSQAIGAVFRVGDVFRAGDERGGGDNLVEDSWIWGKDSAIAIEAGSRRDVWRRVLIRRDGGPGGPEIAARRSRDVSFQNVIVLEGRCGLCQAQPQPNAEGVEWLGALSTAGSARSLEPLRSTRDVERRFGLDGARFGEPGYDTATSASLWPWPNEERIRKEMCLEAGVTRGFCASQSLTRYLKEAAEAAASVAPLSLPDQSLAVSARPPAVRW